MSDRPDEDGEGVDNFENEAEALFEKAKEEGEDLLAGQPKGDSLPQPPPEQLPELPEGIDMPGAEPLKAPPMHATEERLPEAAPSAESMQFAAGTHLPSIIESDRELAAGSSAAGADRVAALSESATAQAHQRLTRKGAAWLPVDVEK
jgi:hypothetical protein